MQEFHGIDSDQNFIFILLGFLRLEAHGARLRTLIHGVCICCGQTSLSPRSLLLRAVPLRSGSERPSGRRLHKLWQFYGKLPNISFRPFSPSCFGDSHIDRKGASVNIPGCFSQYSKTPGAAPPPFHARPNTSIMPSHPDPMTATPDIVVLSRTRRSQRAEPLAFHENINMTTI